MRIAKNNLAYPLLKDTFLCEVALFKSITIYGKYYIKDMRACVKPLHSRLEVEKGEEQHILQGNQK